MTTEQKPKHQEKVEIYWFSEQPNGYVTEDDIAPYPSGKLDFPTPISILRRPTYCITSTTSSMPSPMRWVSMAS